MARRFTGPSVSFFAFQDIITAVVGIFILITLLLVLELAPRMETASSAPLTDVAAVREAIEALEEEIERVEAELSRRISAQHESADLNEFNRQDKAEQAEVAAETAQQRLASLQGTLERTHERIGESEKDEVVLLSEAAALEGDRALLEELKVKLDQVQAAANRMAGDDSPIYRDQTEQGRFISLIVFENRSIQLRDALTRSSQAWSGARRLDDMRMWLNTVELSKRQLFLVIKPGAAADFEAIERDLEQSGAVYGFDVAGTPDRIRLGFEISGLP